MTDLDSRVSAVRVLNNLLKNKNSLSQSFQHEKAITPLTKAICFGVCRHYYRLQEIALSLMPKRQKSPLVWLVILVGLYQLIDLGKPDYAVVKETVEVLKRLQLVWAKGFVNAIFRAFCRDKDRILAELESHGGESFQYGHPAWLLQSIQADWPNDWQSIVEANDQHPPMSLRVNQRKISRDAYLDRLRTAGFEAKVQTHSNVGIVLAQACLVQDLPGFEDGLVSLQDEAAQLAVSLLALKPGFRVLDACAAPGGKTCHILESEPALESCVALDISENRLQRVQENLTRLGLEAHLKQGDAADVETWWDGQLFDRILLDAPCSAVGVIRRHPDIKLLRTAEEVERIILIQQTLLQRVWPLLREGGILVYATCSILRRENEDQIQHFLSTHPDSQFFDSQPAWGHSTGHGWQLLPGEFGCDGFFYSVLTKHTS